MDSQQLYVLWRVLLLHVIAVSFVCVCMCVFDSEGVLALYFNEPWHGAKKQSRFMLHLELLCVFISFLNIVLGQSTQSVPTQNMEGWSSVLWKDGYLPPSLPSCLPLPLSSAWYFLSKCCVQKNLQGPGEASMHSSLVLELCREKHFIMHIVNAFWYNLFNKN